MTFDNYRDRQVLKNPYMVVDITTMKPTHHRYVWITDMESDLRNRQLEKENSNLRYELEPKIIHAVVEKPVKETYCLW